MSDTIFLRVTKDRIPFKAFVASLKNFLLLLQDFDKTISHDSRSSTIWEVVELQKTNPSIIGIAPTQKRGRPNVATIVEEQLIANTISLSNVGERNRYMSDAALLNMENLARLTPKLGLISIYTNGDGQHKKEANITETTLENVRHLTAIRYSALSSIVGNLDAITVHNDNEFRVWDERRNKPIPCKFEEKDFDRVKDMLKTRVRVFGIVRSNSTGKAIEITVKDFEPAPLKTLPTIEEMSGLVQNFTGGKSLKEYMEELSDE